MTEPTTAAAPVPTTEDAKPPSFAEERVNDGMRLREAIASLIVDCESGKMKGRLGVGQMFPLHGERCAVGHVAHRAKGLPFLTFPSGRGKEGKDPNYDAVSYSAVIKANDGSPNDSRDTAVVKPLREWLAAVDEVTGDWRGQLKAKE